MIWKITGCRQYIYTTSMIVQENMTKTSQQVIVGIPPIPRAGQRPPRPRDNINLLSFNHLESISTF